MSTDTSKHWKCSVCLKPGGGQVTQPDFKPYASIEIGSVPDELQFQVQIEPSIRRTYHHVCCEECRAALCWPAMKDDVMLDFVCFMSARNILTNVRESLEGEVAPTLAAFDVIRGFDVDAGTADWLRALEEFYTRSGQVKGLEPIYSLEPERDPAPKIFVAAFLYMYFAGDYRCCLFSILAWASATNRNMAKFLFKHKHILGQLGKEELMSFFDADGGDGLLFKSCTKCGNMKRTSMAQHLSDVWERLAGEDLEKIRESVESCIAGSLKLDDEIKRWKRHLSLEKLGNFKIYFTCKILAQKFLYIRYDFVVGPNLSGAGRDKKDSCAFYQLFQNLPDAMSPKLHHALLQHVLAEAVSLSAGRRNLQGVLSLDVVEHAGCEWVKARRNRAKCAARVMMRRDAYPHGSVGSMDPVMAGVGASGRVLMRRDACPRGASAGASSRHS